MTGYSALMRHPLHPAVVHFPVACWSLAVGADFASLYWGQAAWQWTTGLLVAGCVMAMVAMMAGLVDIARVPGQAMHTVMRDACLHMAMMVAAFLIFCVRLLLGPYGFEPAAPSTLALVLDAGGFIVLVIGGWFGSRLVYSHGVGYT